MEQNIIAPPIHAVKSTNVSLIDDPRYFAYEQAALESLYRYNRVLDMIDCDQYIFTEVPRGTLPGKKLKNLRPAIEPLYVVKRNDDCPCGSGTKFKKCCINKIKTDNETGNETC